MVTIFCHIVWINYLIIFNLQAQNVRWTKYYWKDIFIFQKHNKKISKHLLKPSIRYLPSEYGSNHTTKNICHKSFVFAHMELSGPQSQIFKTRLLQFCSYNHSYQKYILQPTFILKIIFTCNTFITIIIILH